MYAGIYKTSWQNWSHFASAWYINHKPHIKTYTLFKLSPYPKCRGESSCLYRTSWGRHRASWHASPPSLCSEDSGGGRWSAACSPHHTCPVQTWWCKVYGLGIAPRVQKKWGFHLKDEWIRSVYFKGRMSKILLKTMYRFIQKQSL